LLVRRSPPTGMVTGSPMNSAGRSTRAVLLQMARYRNPFQLLAGVRVSYNLNFVSKTAGGCVTTSKAGVCPSPKQAPGASSVQVLRLAVLKRNVSEKVVSELEAGSSSRVHAALYPREKPQAAQY
jgi:hypothetical protein